MACVHVALQHLQAQSWPSRYPVYNSPDSKVHGAIIGPIWGRQDPGGPHVGPMNFAIWEEITELLTVVIVVTSFTRGDNIIINWDYFIRNIW